MQHDVGVVRSYASKSEIIHENDPADRVYEVISGAVCTSRTLREGRRQIAGFYFSGDVFGLESAEKQVLTAKAITSTTVRVVKKSALKALTFCNFGFTRRTAAVAQTKPLNSMQKGLVGLATNLPLAPGSNLQAHLRI